MAEQTFRSPGFFEKEIDLSARKEQPTGTPAGIIGTAQRGPAFVPVTVGSFADFETKFGGLDPSRFGPYAVREFLKHRKALTYMRVLGAGSNESGSEMSNTAALGVVKNAGFACQANDGSDSQMALASNTPDGPFPGMSDLESSLQGGMQFLVARHQLRPLESEGCPTFTDSPSVGWGADPAGGAIDVGGGLDLCNIIRASILVASGTRTLIADGDFDITSVDWTAEVPNDFATANTDGFFKLILSSSSGANFGRDDGINGLRVLTASLNPTSPAYVGKILNTNTDKFQEMEHVLWCDYSVEDELAIAGFQFTTDVDGDGDRDDDEVPITDGIAILRGSDNWSAAHDALSEGQREFRQLFGRFDTRYKVARTPAIISQPYGATEYELFHFESLDDGAYANDKFKVSIRDLRASTDPGYDYGTFTVQIRRFSDTDTNKEVIEAYPECSLDPFSDRYIARQIGDYKVLFDFDAEDDDERRLIISGKYPNRSATVRVVMNDQVDNAEACLPKDMIPFGFKGIPVIKTNDTLTDGGADGVTLVGAIPNGATPGLPTALLTDATATEDGGGAYNNWRGVDSGNDTPVRLRGYVNAVGGGVENGTVQDAATAARVQDLQGSIVPPLPLRFKCTRGSISDGGNGLVARDINFIGDLGTNERADSRFYWGVKFERCPRVGEAGASAALNTNVSTSPNPLIKAYAKFQGIEKLDTILSGSAADDFHANKFTLARVAFSNPHDEDDLLGGEGSIETHITGTASQHMAEAAYFRNGGIDETTYCITDTILNASRAALPAPLPAADRMTMATLVHNDKIKFNRFGDWTKFTTMFYGGFDGINVLDYDVARMNDRASSTEIGDHDDGTVSGVEGKAGAAFTDDGLMHPLDLAEADEAADPANTSGAGRRNNVVSSYRKAVDLMTDSMTVNTNILCIPGIRDSFVTDLAAERTRAYSKAIYLMDIPYYDENSARIFMGTPDQSTKKADVAITAESFESRAFDNNYCASYFPDVWIDDPVNNLKVRTPATVAALAALAFNDKVSYPWFAPAGFNRGALDMVSNVTTRLTAGDRDTLYDSRLNPIAVFPNAGFVIFGQKTLQMQKSALDRVNVRRMLLEVKRLIVSVANSILFEPNTPQTRARFVGAVVPLLALVQAQAGIEQFQVVMDDTNNTVEDYENNRLNGRIVLVPTRAIEFIAVDFIITNSGVLFE